MPTQTSSVLVGSRPSIPATTLAVTANAVAENLAFTVGTYYLDHNTAGLSLRAALATLLDTHSELAGVVVIVTRSLRIRITSGVAFALTWGADTTLRDLLGFTGNLASATAHTATNVSPLLWAAAKPESSSARQGTSGKRTADTQAGRSGPGIVTATRNNEWFENSFLWRNVDVDLVKQTSDVGGTYDVFWQHVLALYRRFWLARDRTYDASDTTTSIALTGSYLPSSGAYVRKPGDEQSPHDRTIENFERFINVSLDVETAMEYGA